MPNHVHLILTPSTVEALGRAMGEAHRRYTSFVNARARWSGHLFQGRYASVAMDEAHLIAAVRTISLNPVRARLVCRAEDWAWSSVRAHLSGEDDGLVRAPGTRSGRTVWPTHRRWGGGGATLRRGAARVEIVGDHRPSIGSNRLRGRSRTAPRQTACAARAGAKASNRARETSELILREVECRGMGHT